MTSPTDVASTKLKISTHTLTWSVTRLLGLLKLFLILISTHTLTWSVTGTAKNWVDYENISTHTLTWSVTVKSAM